MNKLATALVGTVIVIGGATYYLSDKPVTVDNNRVQAPVTASVQTAKAGPDEIYPDVPGVTDPETSNDIAGTICNSSWSTKSIRPPVSVTDPIKTVALARYNKEHGTTYTKADGELDHLISLEIGGAPADPNNLWFEPYTTQIDGKQVGAREKDKVENELHKEVCAGQMPIGQAQTIITTDWYNFYLQKIGN